MKKKREANSESLGEVIKHMADQYGWQHSLEEAKIKQMWEDFLGREITLRTDFIRVKEGVLYARMKDSVTRHEVFMRRTALKEYINRELAEEVVREVRLH